MKYDSKKNSAESTEPILRYRVHNIAFRDYVLFLQPFVKIQ